MAEPQTAPPPDDGTLGVAVQASTSRLGDVAVAFVAYVEIVDADGQRHVVEVRSDGCTDARAEALKSVT